MQIPDDDERFESYLKQFRPTQAAPLSIEASSRTKLRPFVFIAAAAAVLIIAIGAAFWYQHRRITPPEARQAEPASARVTLGQAQAELAQGSSFDEALDRLERASKPQPNPKPENHTQSALQVLGREKL